jgi:hypothetical protein
VPKYKYSLKVISLPNTSNLSNILKTNNSLSPSYQRGALGRFSFCNTQVAKQAQVRPTYTNTAYLRQSGVILINMNKIM